MIRIRFVKLRKVFFKVPIEFRQQAIGRLDSEQLSNFLELSLQILPNSATRQRVPHYAKSPARLPHTP